MKRVSVGIAEWLKFLGRIDAKWPAAGQTLAEQGQYLLVVLIIVAWQASWWLFQIVWPQWSAAPVVLGDLMRIAFCFYLLGIVAGGKLVLSVLKRRLHPEIPGGFRRPEIGPDDPPPWGDAKTLSAVSHVVRVENPLLPESDEELGTMLVRCGVAQVPCDIHPTHPDRSFLESLREGDLVVWLSQEQPADCWGWRHASYMRFYPVGIVPSSA